jgi:hypothetical protein
MEGIEWYILNLEKKINKQNCSSILVCPSKLSFIIEVEIKTFHDK